MEEWKDIKDYEGIYQASSLGNIRSFYKNRVHILTPCMTTSGYYKVTLCKDGVQIQRNVHRLIAETFLPNPDNLPEVNHKTEIKIDNRVENLEWCSREYNVNYGTTTQRRADKMKNNHLSKPVSQYSKEGEFIKEYPSLHEAERATGVNSINICQCCTNYRGAKTAGGFIWKYK